MRSLRRRFSICFYATFTLLLCGILKVLQHKLLSQQLPHEAPISQRISKQEKLANDPNKKRFFNRSTDNFSTARHIFKYCHQCPLRHCSRNRGTGNPLIDCYGQGGVGLAGQDGSGVLLANQASSATAEFGLNTNVSDLIALNRRVPDSRPPGCADLRYSPFLSQASIVLTVYNEWPSVLLRAIYSLLNRTPEPLIKEILIVDDASTLDFYAGALGGYLSQNLSTFPIRLVRLKSRGGVVAARLAGASKARGDVLVFLDSHVEVQEGWLQPLLHEVSKDMTTVAMAEIDNIDKDTFLYTFNSERRLRYLILWNLSFFGDYWRPQQLKAVTAIQPLEYVLANLYVPPSVCFILRLANPKLRCIRAICTLVQWQLFDYFLLHYSGTL